MYFISTLSKVILLISGFYFFSLLLEKMHAKILILKNFWDLLWGLAYSLMC